LRNAGQRRDLFTIDKRSLSSGRAKNGKQQDWHDRNAFHDDPPIASGTPGIIIRTLRHVFNGIASCQYTVPPDASGSGSSIRAGSEPDCDGA